MNELHADLTAWRRAKAEYHYALADAYADALLHLDAVEPLVVEAHGQDARTAELRSVKATLRDGIRENRDKADALGDAQL